MPDQNPRDFLLALLSDETRWAIFDELARKKENELAPILRPHDEIRLHRTRELEAIDQRRRLDEALGQPDVAGNRLRDRSAGRRKESGQRLATGRADGILEAGDGVGVFLRLLQRLPLLRRAHPGLPLFRGLLATTATYAEYERRFDQPPKLSHRRATAAGGACPQATRKQGTLCSPIFSKYGETNGGTRR
jgi:hypothetical protein